MLIILCGGTFDKAYDPLAQALVLKEGTTEPFKTILASGRVGQEDMRILRLFSLDSLEMTDDHRLKLKKVAWEAAEKEAVVIIHGTDRMVESAKFLFNMTTHPIIFTGAMIPFSVRGSDATFNLGSAMMAAKLKENGVWIVMNGQCWDPFEVKKEGGVFMID